MNAADAPPALRRAASDQVGGEIVDPFAVPYTLRLCDAIERFTEAAARRHRRAFLYRGAELRYAVERLLYFALINDEDAYRYFRNGGRADHLSPAARLLAPFLADANHDRSSLPSLSRLRWSVSSLARRAADIGDTASIRAEGVTAGTSPVLFLVIQPKFTTFLLPVASATALPFAFVTVGDEGLFQDLVQRGLPRIALDAARPAPCGAVPPGLAPFGHLASTYDVLLDALLRLRPRCLVIPEGNAPVNEIANRAAQAAAIPTLCVQQGWSPIIHSGFRNMSYRRMAVWGEGFADLLRPHNPRQHFLVTGSHAIRLRPLGEAAARRSVGFFLQKGTRLITEAAWKACLDLIDWTATQFPRAEIRVRPHPGAPLSGAERASMAGLPNVRVMGSETHGLDEVLSGCRVAVSVFSTTILEAAAAGTVPLIVNVTGLPNYMPDIAASGAAVEVKDFAAARAALLRLMEGDDGLAAFAEPMAAMRRRFFAGDAEDALRAVAAAIRASTPDPAEAFA